MRAKKTARQNHALLVHAVRTLLVGGELATQEGVRQSLAKQNIIVTQSKISRLFRQLGAIKTSNHEGDYVYALPVEPLLPPKHSALGQLVLDIMTNETMIVIRTNPGSASLIARLIDHQHQELNILGTIAGDDTLFVVPKTMKQIKKIAAKLQQLLVEA